jgi:Cys-tRNA(Pro)/Cys-tRNA(Cys) deacylase
MIPQKTLLPLTWYVHWGCSPIGMKKSFKTFIDSSAKNHDSVIFSWWKVWYQVEISLEDLCNLINITIWDITKD